MKDLNKSDLLKVQKHKISLTPCHPQDKETISGKRFGDIDLVTCLTDVVGPVPFGVSTCVSHMSVGEVVLTLYILMVNYITLDSVTY
jgi:hypothetical protein